MLNCTFAGRPGPCGPAATGITVARPGHDCDCAQAPVRLVACRAAGVVTCSRLVVCKIRPWARGPVPVRLLATHAYPASDGWHGRFKFSWPSTEAHRHKSCGKADHGSGYDTQRAPWHRHSPNAKRAAGPGQDKNFSEFRTRLPYSATRRGLYTINVQIVV